MSNELNAIFDLEKAYKNLASAIIMRAVLDYYVLRENADRYKGKLRYDYPCSIEEIKSFFLGGWISLLTDIDGKAILDSCERMYKSGEYKQYVRDYNQAV